MPICSDLRKASRCKAEAASERKLVGQEISNQGNQLLLFDEEDRIKSDLVELPEDT